MIVRLAVTTHVRHLETPCDHLLAKGWGRYDAHHQVEEQVRSIPARWKA
jgi:hypothetical protein